MRARLSSAAGQYRKTGAVLPLNPVAKRGISPPGSFFAFGFIKRHGLAERVDPEGHLLAAFASAPAAPL